MPEPVDNKPQGGGDNPPVDPPKDPPAGSDDKGADGGGEGGGDAGFKAFLEKKNFKTEEEAIKYFDDLESNNTKLSQERDQYQKYYPYALAFSSYLKSDEDAMKRYKTWSEGKDDDDGGDDGGGGEGGGDKPPQDDAARKNIGELLGLERDRAVSSFDGKYGLSQLPRDKYNEVAGQMGATLRSWGIDLQRPTTEVLKRLPKALEDAYALIRIDEAKKDGKLEGFLEATQDRTGRIPSIPATYIDNPDDITEGSLSEPEKKAAEKMGLTPKEYAQSKKEIVQEASS